MGNVEAGKSRMICYDYSGMPVALIEMWLETKNALEQQAVIITLYSKVAIISGKTK